MHLARSNARELNDQKSKQMHHRGARNHQKQASHLLDFSQQNTIRHELDACGRCNIPLVANLVGHFSEMKVAVVFIRCHITLPGNQVGHFFF